MVARLHRPGYSANERAFYGRHLRDGGTADSTKGLQGQLAELMNRLPAGGPRPYRRQGAHQDGLGQGYGVGALENRLQRIDRLESLLVPAEAAFGFLMGHNGSKVEDVAQELRKTWGRLSFIDVDGLPSSRPRWPRLSTTSGGRALGAAWAGLAGGDYETVLKLLVEHNGFVMGARNGSDPWVRVTKGVFEVRFRDAGEDCRPRRTSNPPGPTTTSSTP